MTEFDERKIAADFLNTKGYDIEFDKDGFWLEDQRWDEMKTKNVIDEMNDFAKKQKSEMLRIMLELETIDREMYNYYFSKFIIG